MKWGFTIFSNMVMFTSCWLVKTYFSTSIFEHFKIKCREGIKGTLKQVKALLGVDGFILKQLIVLLVVYCCLRIFKTK
jgi:hypothetical protein